MSTISPGAAYGTNTTIGDSSVSLILVRAIAFPSAATPVTSIFSNIGSSFLFLAIFDIFYDCKISEFTEDFIKFAHAI